MHHMNRQSILLWLTAALLGLGVATSQAARPLGTEDAGTNGPMQCQLEAWTVHAPAQHDWHLAPACGVGLGLELGWESAQGMPRHSQDLSRTAALKWAPEWLDWQGWRFGLKASGEQARATSGPDTAWHVQQSAWTGIVSVPLNPDWALHTNLGRSQQKSPHEGRNTYGFALTWAPHEHWLVFAEANGDHRSPATRTVGARWWVIPDVLGLDLTHSVTNATAGSHNTGVGLGWYGLQF
jgi:hypothetical protein